MRGVHIEKTSAKRVWSNHLFFSSFVCVVECVCVCVMANEDRLLKSVTLIKDLRPGMKNVTCVFLVIEKGQYPWLQPPNSSGHVS